MEAKCSCSDCETFACYTKHQNSQGLYNPQPLSKTCLYFNSLDKDIGTLSFGGNKVTKTVTEDESFDNDEDYDESFDTRSAASQEDNLYERHTPLIESSLKFSPSRAELSALIMNFPFQDFRSSLNTNIIAPRSNAYKHTPFYIYEKLKEVYKACSCKVCECIIGKSQTYDRCRCKPCGCEECDIMKEEVTISKDISFRSIGYPSKTREQDCQKHERTLVSKLVGRDLRQVCNCKPCECSECKKISGSCAREKYNCSGCESSQHMATKFQKLVVATVESENQDRVECSCAPCTCLDCSHRYDRAASSNTRHDMSTGMTRHLGCHCTTCRNEACILDGTNACSCKSRNRDRVMRKPVQRDTNFDIHRSVVTHKKSKTNRGRHDLIAMFAAVTKVCPEFEYKLKECTCGECECVSCDYIQDSANAVKTSKVIITDTNSNDTFAYVSLPINHELKARKSCLKTNTNTSSYSCDFDMPHKLTKEPYRFSDIKLSGKNSSTILECSSERKCERCVSRNEVIYPIKKGEKLTPAIFEHKLNRSFIMFRDETLEDKAHLSSPEEKYEIVENNACEDNNSYSINSFSRTILSNVEQNFGLKVNTKPKKTSRAQIFPHSSKTPAHLRRKFNKHNDEKFKVSNSDVCNVSKDTTKLYSVNNTVKRDNSNNKNSNILLKKYKNENFLPVSTNFQNARANDLLDMHTPPRFIKTTKKGPSTLNYEKNIIADDYKFEQASSSDGATTNMAVNEKNGLIANSSESKKELNKRAVHYSNSIEKAHRDKKIENLEAARNKIAKIDRMKHNFDYDEDYRRAQKTLKESREFSLHLIKLLNQYEEANKEFKSIDHNLMHLEHSYILPNVHPHQGLLNIEAWRTENHSNNANTKNSYNNVHTRTNINHTPRIFSNGNTSIYKNINKRTNQLQSKKALNQSIDDAIHLNRKTISNFKRNSIMSKDHLQKIISDARPIESTEICPRTFIESTNNKTLQEIERDSSSTSSSNSLDMHGNSIKRDKSLNFIETNKQIGEYHTVGGRKKFTKMCKEAVTESNQRILFSTQLAKCSITTETAKDMYKADRESYREIDQQMTQTESKVAVTVSTAEKTAFKNIDDLTAVKNVESHLLIHRQSSTEQKHVIMNSPAENGSKKNLSNTITRSDGLVGVYRKKSLEKGIKDAVIAIKQASLTWEANYLKSHKNPEGRRESEALVRLHTEVKKLLELPLVQKCIIEPNESK